MSEDLGIIEISTAFRRYVERIGGDELLQFDYVVAPRPSEKSFHLIIVSPFEDIDNSAIETIADKFAEIGCDVAFSTSFSGEFRNKNVLSVTVPYVETVKVYSHMDKDKLTL